MPERPQHFGVRPGGFSGHTHIPHRRNIVNTSVRGIDDADHANGEIWFHLILDAFEQFVHAVEVLTPRLIRSGIAASSFEYLYDALRQVAID
jgi:hypothetical protein